MCNNKKLMKRQRGGRERSACRVQRTSLDVPVMIVVVLDNRIDDCIFVPCLSVVLFRRVLLLPLYPICVCAFPYSAVLFDRSGGTCILI